MTKLRLLLAGTWHLRPSNPHVDLWNWVRDSLLALDAGQVSVYKVMARVSLTSVSDDIQRWLVLHNVLADEAARVANLTRPDSFWQLWERHSGQVEAHLWLARHVVTHQVAVMQRWFQNKTSLQPDKEYVPKERKQFPMSWEVPATLEPTRRFRQAFGTDLKKRVLHWWQRVFDQNSGQLQWCSYAQLFLHWVLDEQHPGVVKNGKRWIDCAATVVHPAGRYKFRVRARWFRLMLQEFMKACGLKVARANLRPASEFLHVHIGCVSAPMRQSAHQAVEDWLRRSLRSPVKRMPHLDSLVPG